MTYYFYVSYDLVYSLVKKSIRIGFKPSKFFLSSTISNTHSLNPRPAPS
jgi:hypothetical protein